MNIPILIMAAGNSSRLGEAKQLLPFKNGTLISYVVQQCIASELGPVNIVVGSRAAKIKKAIENLNCKTIANEDWKNGLGSSIACGVDFIPKDDIEGVIVVLVDQVFFTKSILMAIKEKRMATQAPIISCSYMEGAGPPTFFEASLFDELSQLNGEPGAKKLVKKYRPFVETVAFPHGHLDIDLPQDLVRLNTFNI